MIGGSGDGCLSSMEHDDGGRVGTMGEVSYNDGMRKTHRQDRLLYHTTLPFIINPSSSPSSLFYPPLSITITFP